MKQKDFVPPDGGWAWVIMLAYALNNLMFIPIMQCFGLIFKVTFSELNLSATDGSIIMTTNAAFGMIMGLMNGPLLKRFSFRQVAIAGSLLLTGGIITTSFGTKFEHIFITYGLITSFGIGIGMASYSLALNTYFLKNRGKAVGFAFTLTSLGTIGVPQLISYLLSVYSVHGVILIMGGIASNTLIAAMLLQPVKWHVKKQTELLENYQEQNKDPALHENDENLKLIEKPTEIGGDTSQVENYDSDISPAHSSDSESLFERHPSPSHKVIIQDDLARQAPPSDTEPTKTKWWSSMQSINSVHLGSSLKLFEEIDGNKPSNNVIHKRRSAISLVYNPNLSIEIKRESIWTRWFRRVVDFFDLTLLKDPIYVNIMVGMSVAVFAEQNFSLLTPFILADLGMTTPNIAAFMSVLSTADLVCRFISPFIGDYFKKTPRIMYVLSLIVLIIGRSLFFIFTSYGGLLFVAVVLGLTKGIRTVYMTLVIPSYVPLEKLAAASGLQMVLNGILILCLGPFLGVLRDNTGSYNVSIVIMNVMTALTIILWTAEIVYFNAKSNQSADMEHR